MKKVLSMCKLSTFYYFHQVLYSNSNIPVTKCIYEKLYHIVQFDRNINRILDYPRVYHHLKKHH